MRVVIAEDNALLREGLTRLLDGRGFEVAAAVGDGPSLVAAVVRRRPDVVVVDVRMPPTFRDEGLRASLEARRQAPQTAVMILSQYVEQSYASELLRGGGVGPGICSRIAWPTLASSSMRCAVLPPEAPRSTPRWWLS